MTARVLIALVAGLLLGTLAAASGSGTLTHIATGIEPVGTMWINAIRMTVIPLVVALIVTGVAGQAETRRLGRLGAAAFAAFIVLLLGSGLLSAVLGPILLTGLSVPPDLAASLRAGAGQTMSGATQVPSLVQRLVGVMPANPVKAAADGAMLPLVVFTLLFALALMGIAAERRQRLVDLFQGVADAMLVLVRWVLAVAPIGIFALAAPLAARMGAGATTALLQYVGALAGTMVVCTAALYPVAALVGRTPLGRFALATAPAQAVAFSSRSSLAALPALIEGARDRLDASPIVTGFALPLAVSVFRLNVPAGFVIGALFLGKLYGVALAPAAIGMLIVTSVLLSFAVPGIPSGSLFILAPVLVGLGLPAEGVGVLIALDPIPDMFKTMANSTAHMTAAVIVGRVEHGRSPTASAV
jgi:proton glutamate symport protein